MSRRACPTVCDHQGCGKPAAKMPELQFWALGYPRDTHPPIPLAIAMAACLEHATDTVGAELIEANFNLVQGLILSAGKALPDKATAKVRWWDIGDPKAPHRHLWSKA